MGGVIGNSAQFLEGETDDVRVSPRGYSCVAPQDVAHDHEA